MRLACICLAAGFLLSSCSAPGQREEPPKIYQPGQQATAGSFTYGVNDAWLVTRLGEDAATARYPQNRFYLVEISISNNGNSNTAIPAMALVDENGKSYNELTDGAGIQHWLGIVRTVPPGQTARGVIGFDAPLAHYRLRLTDEFERPEVSVDLPLSFVRQQLTQPAAAPSFPPPESTSRAGR